MIITAHARCTLAAFAGLAFCGGAQAGDFFPTFNQGALQRSAELPALGEARVVAPGATAWYGALDLTSEYYTDSNATESVLEDGESARVSLSYRASPARNWEWNVEVPVLILGGGFLDSSIESWHDTFGLPGGGRELAPHNAYHYQYVRNGVILLDETRSGTQLGDIRLGGGWQLSDATAVRAQIKLPTGDGNRLGGGNTGLALWLDHGLQLGANWSAYLSGGATAASRSDVLPDLQQHAAAFGGAGLSWQVFDSLSITTQLYAHTALFKDTELDGLKNPGLQFVLGLGWRVAPGMQFNLAFQEDPIVNSSPDFSLHFGFGIR